MQKSIVTVLCMAALSSPAWAAPLKIKPNAPTRYVVKQGDTLWSISGKYLYRPYKWPKLWGANKGRIKNPHLIYPGQVLYLSYVNGRPTLTAKAGAGGIPRIKLSPRVRDMGSGYGIPTIDVDFYRLFMKHPQFVTDAELQQAARIVAGPDNRVLFATGDRIYADGLVGSGDFLIFRTSQHLKDPVTGKSLGQLVEFAGEASTLGYTDTAYENRDNVPMTAKQRQALGADEHYVQQGKKLIAARSAVPLMLTAINSEIRQGDFLIPKEEVMPHFNAMPQEPEQSIQANIVSMMEGVSEAGMGQTLILNKGEAHGLTAGTVLSIYKNSRLVKSAWANPNNKKAAEYVNIPSEEIGLAMVYRTGENVSSAIVLESKVNVSREDVLREPNRDLETFNDNMIESERLIHDNTGDMQNLRHE